MLVVKRAVESKLVLLEERRSIEPVLKFVALLGVVDRDMFWGVIFVLFRDFKFEGGLTGTLGLLFVVYWFRLIELFAGVVYGWPLIDVFRL